MAIQGIATALSNELAAYLRARFGRDDDLLRTLKREALAAGLPEIQITEEEAAFLQVLLRAIHARRVLELGTLGGYSAIAMARALPADGHLTTIERDPKHAAFARRFIDRAGLADRVTVIEGAGLDVLPTLEGPFEFAFLDADKSNYTRYLEHCLRLIPRGGLIGADNAFAFGELFEKTHADREAPAMIAFNEQVARDARLQSMIVPVGDGLMLSVVL